MKKFQLSIEKPCDANLLEMQKTNDGFFCTMCTKEVVDLSNLSQYEISKFISENRNNSICARMKTTQLDMEFDLIEQAKINRGFKYAAVAASVLAVSSLQAQEHKTIDSSSEVIRQLTGTVGQVSLQKTENEIKIKGKVIDKNTKLPINNKRFENLYISITGLGYREKINNKKGTFVFRNNVFKDKRNYNLKIETDNNDYSYFEYNSEIEIDFTQTIKNTLNLTIEVDVSKFITHHLIGAVLININE